MSDAAPMKALPPWVVRGALAVALLPSLWLVLRGDAMVPDKPFVEDSFYALTAARNAGTGRGLSVDGIAPAAGVEPLWVLITAPFFAATGDGRFAALRLVAALEWAAWAAAAWGAARLALRWLPRTARGSAPWLAPFTVILWAGSAHLWRECFSGLGTGLYVCLLMWTAVAYVGLDRQRRRGFVLLGLLAGVVVLARADAISLAAILAVAELARRDGGPPRAARAAAIVVPALLVVSPWWIRNLVVAGSLSPSDGRPGSGDWGPTRDMLDAVASGIVPFAWAWRSEGAVFSLVRAVAAGVVAALGAARVGRESFSDPSRTWLWRVFAGFVAALCVWHLSPSQPSAAYPRHLVPGAVLGVPFVAALLVAWAGRGDPRRRLALGAAGAVLVALAAAFPFLAGTVSEGSPMLRHQLALVQTHVPAGERVAAHQTGTLGYFRDGAVNLDGRGTAQTPADRGNAELYLTKNDLRWYCDERDLVRAALGNDPPRHGWREVAGSGRFVLLRRD